MDVTSALSEMRLIVTPLRTLAVSPAKRRAPVNTAWPTLSVEARVPLVILNVSRVSHWPSYTFVESHARMVKATGVTFRSPIVRMTIEE